MRKLLLAALFVALFSLTGRAQGTISIDNAFTNANTLPTATSYGSVFSLDANNLPILETNSFSVAVYGGPNPTNLSLIATLLGFEGQLIVIDPGTFVDSVGGVYPVPGVPAGSPAYLNVLAWEGPFTSFADANLAGALTGSVLFPNPTGGVGIPPSLPADFTGMPALLLQGNPNITAQFASQPQSRTNLTGSSATFTATVIDQYGEPISNAVLQWQKDGTNLANGGRISGASTATLTISDIAGDDAGRYSLSILVAGVYSYSQAAVLTVIDTVPVFTVQPRSVTNLTGTTATFTAAATDQLGGPISNVQFQWQKNGANLVNGGKISGATTGTLAISDLAPGDAGNYSVSATAQPVVTYSANATLTILPPPVVGLTMSSGAPLLSLTGADGYTFRVQYTTDLAGANWQDLLTVTVYGSSPFEFTDSTAAGQPARFYRAIMR